MRLPHNWHFDVGLKGGPTSAVRFMTHPEARTHSGTRSFVACRGAGVRRSSHPARWLYTWRRHPRASCRRAGSWQLVDFRDGVAPDDQAGIEAALEAAGILDGWVTPGGELLDPDTEDTILTAADREHKGSRLTEALVPAIDHGTGITESDVSRLLATIGLGESDSVVWVSAGGRFRNGVVRGAWHKPTAACEEWDQWWGRRHALPAAVLPLQKDRWPQAPVARIGRRAHRAATAQRGNSHGSSGAQKCQPAFHYR